MFIFSDPCSSLIPWSWCCSSVAGDEGEKNSMGDGVLTVCVWHSVFEEVAKLKKMDGIRVELLGCFLSASESTNVVCAVKSEYVEMNGGATEEHWSSDAMLAASLLFDDSPSDI